MFVRGGIAIFFVHCSGGKPGIQAPRQPREGGQETKHPASQEWVRSRYFSMCLLGRNYRVFLFVGIVLQASHELVRGHCRLSGPCSDREGIDRRGGMGKRVGRMLWVL